MNRHNILDAAIRVLAIAERDDMSPKEMTDAMILLGWWTPPNAGETPWETLGAAIYREIQAEGDLARFVKTAPGRFHLR